MRCLGVIIALGATLATACQPRTLGAAAPTPAGGVAGIGGGSSAAVGGAGGVATNGGAGAAVSASAGVASGAGGVSDGSPATGIGFGTLVTLQEHATTESGAGVKLAMLEVHWDRYEPQAGLFSEAYADEVKARLRAFLDAGMRVTLGLGTHNPPAWLTSYENARYRSQNGEEAQLNFVFNAKVRARAELYLERLASDLPFNNFWAVRLSSGGDPELLYPALGNGFYAYDVNAQNGPDLPASVAPNPFPGWRPGDGGLSKEQIGDWLHWYYAALVDVADWQMKKLEGLGFQGYFQLLTPGSGARPEAWEKAIESGLVTDAELLARGAAWAKVYELLPNKTRVMAYVSSVADYVDKNDSCDSSDVTKALTDPALNSWSSTRWLSRVADEFGLLKAGENVGYDAPPSFNDYYRSGQMMKDAIRQARSCGFSAFYWAHDERLWDGTVSFSDYAEHITEVNGEVAFVPAFP